jgi:hypothetical protein
MRGWLNCTFFPLGANDMPANAWGIKFVRLSWVADSYEQIV